MSSNQASGHVSRASGSSVWFVYASDRGGQVPGLVPPQPFARRGGRASAPARRGWGGCRSVGPRSSRAASPSRALPRRKRRRRSATRAGDEEILLHETQRPALLRGVVRIEDAGERLGRQGLGEGADEIAGAEPLEVEEVGRAGGPEPERVDRLAAVPDDRPVVRDTRTGVDGRPGTGRSAPACSSKEQLSRTSTRSSGRATSHGSGRSSQLSGCSCCQPSRIDCLKIP